MYAVFIVCIPLTEIMLNYQYITWHTMYSQYLSSLIEHLYKLPPCLPNISSADWCTPVLQHLRHYYLSRIR